MATSLVACTPNHPISTSMFAVFAHPLPEPHSSLDGCLADGLRQAGVGRAVPQLHRLNAALIVEIARRLVVGAVGRERSLGMELGSLLQQVVGKVIAQDVVDQRSL